VQTAEALAMLDSFRKVYGRTESIVSADSTESVLSSRAQRECTAQVYAEMRNSGKRGAAQHGASASGPLATVQGLLKARACSPCPTLHGEPASSARQLVISRHVYLRKMLALLAACAAPCRTTP